MYIFMLLLVAIYMKRLLLVAVLALIAAAVYGQQNASTPSIAASEGVTEIYDIVEEAPMPVGGMEVFYSFLAKTVEYPGSAFITKTTGTVFVRFIISEEGNLTSPEVIKGVSPDIDAEAIRVLLVAADSIKWQPGKQHGKNVNVRKVIPIKFNMVDAPKEFLKELEAKEKAAQKKKKPEPTVVETLEGEPVYVHPEVWPKAKGDSFAHSKFGRDNLAYPDGVKGVDGEVMVSFIVTAPDGIIKNLHVSRSVDSVLDAQAMKFVKAFNERFSWKPGKVRRKEVHTRMNFPVKFVYQMETSLPVADRYDTSLYQTTSIIKDIGMNKVAKLRNSRDPETDKVRVVNVVDIAPQPKGGVAQLYEFIYSFINYPSDAIAEYREGVVEVEVLVKANGQTQIIAINYGGPFLALGHEAARSLYFFNQRVGWLPATVNNKRCDAVVVVPVRFMLKNITHTEDRFIVNMVSDEDSLIVVPTTSTDEVFDVVEEEAQPVNGMNAYYELLAKNIDYPREAQRLGIGGTTFVRFVIDENGKVASAETVSGSEQGFGIDEEAVRVVKLTKWLPAKQRGKFVKQRKILPVKFKLNY